MLISISLLMITHAIGQSEHSSKQKKEIVVNVYAGGPNLQASFVEVVLSVDTVMNVKQVSAGTKVPLLGARVSYSINPRISLGGDVNYRVTEIDFYGNIDGEFEIYRYYAEINQIRMSLRAEYHFDTENDKLDLYIPASIGYKYTLLVLKTTDPNYRKGQVNFNRIPVSTRIGFGMRYFIEERIGFGIEIGAGNGGVIQGGLTFRV